MVVKYMHHGDDLVELCKLYQLHAACYIDNLSENAVRRK